MQNEQPHTVEISQKATCVGEQIRKHGCRAVVAEISHRCCPRQVSTDGADHGASLLQTFTDLTFVGGLDGVLSEVAVATESPCCTTGATVVTFGPADMPALAATAGA